VTTRANLLVGCRRRSPRSFRRCKVDEVAATALEHSRQCELRNIDDTAVVDVHDFLDDRNILIHEQAGGHDGRYFV
jgi:hypothetical protein